ncbi:NAD(P)/FAD-dependent oxidoreductase [Nocardia arizonensis]|uniref:NAD(P)/FAD-dependent oxidoreductase n=1 Tax=Nocardia arizonensis TaxID=1141647 RepID=UPI0006D0A326|nr:NAD(P)/FAD-dependent oxidoreductase [Nocardia arizonensis]
MRESSATPTEDTTLTEDSDVVVVGARCAGSATAIPLASAGRRVIVLDGAAFPSDALSTHLLWPAGVLELRELGVLERVEAIGAPRLTTAMAVGAGHRMTAPFTALDGTDYALCVRRVHLDAALVDAAVAAGADVRQKCRVLELIREHGRCRGVRYRDPDGVSREIRASLVVGADGRHSTVARLVGAQEPFLAQPSGRDCYFAYWRDADPDHRHIAAQWRAGGDLGTAFPCDDGLVLSLVQPPAATGPLRPGEADRRYHEAIARLPELGARLRGSTQVGRVRSATGLSSYFRHSAGPGWALAGDAGHFKDPVTAQGIRDAMHYGRELARRILPVLDNPVALDAVVRGWAELRLRECLEVYRWTNRLARGEAMRPWEVEMYHDAVRDPVLAAAIIEIFSRTRKPGELFTPRESVLLSTRALWRSRAHPSAVLGDIVRELRDTAAEWLESRRALHPPNPSATSVAVHRGSAIVAEFDSATA